ncbi:MAG: SIS domain-containing protein [Candidatus Eremiobacteraeota bacterium]|nr:SIS domain-containing protein [Candidatus Eremiobacteraeota bacterium]MBV8331633.1 SIS domain-containing protein [Candidatus Eremiobacteraeota bacterium]MBV8434782.1 SIS domain-containing protein [Candidatus Eremiobacteraeota bacterium]MBV8583059.1 SIS domain-containing protein [Candidatus Eremiobacteraeota bacterium]MBV8655640.1 SIS domain-containing protein [Candidatus Eremiobacteraeota bacterium]
MPDYKAQRGFDELLADRHGLLEAPHYREQVQSIAGAIVRALRDGKKVLWCGNGGSAAEAQHMAAELSGRFLRERPGLYSEALSVNSSTLTCIGNDYGYDRVFARQVEAFARPGDVVIGMTTSGTSRNVVLALEAARERGAVTVAFTGNGGGAVADIADLSLVGPNGYAAIVQEVHQVMAHIVCDLVEQELIFEHGLGSGPPR